MKKLIFGLTLAGSLITGCGASTPDAGTQQQELVVMHTETELLVSDRSTWSDSLKQKLGGYFPAACVDGDSDGDGVPDSMDKDSRGSDDSSSSSSDAGTSNSNGACRRCERGPGAHGEFRLKVKDGEVELKRGRVASRTSGSVTVIGPEGAITILVDASTDVRDGEPTPGAEIRAEGVLAAGERTFRATRLKVLCPAPTPVNFPELPADAAPVPTIDVTGSSGDDDGTPDQGKGDN